jgi:hypothetical protein
LAWWLRDPVYTWRPLVMPLVRHATLQTRLGLMPPAIQMVLPCLPRLGVIELQSGGEILATIKPSGPDEDDLVAWDDVHAEPHRLAIRHAASVALKCREVERLVQADRALQVDRSSLLEDIQFIIQQDNFVYAPSCSVCTGRATSRRPRRLRGGQS